MSESRLSFQKRCLWRANVFAGAAIVAATLSIDIVPVTDAAVIIFGGSWSDAGNAANITNGTEPRSDVYADDRFTNGPAYFDHLNIATEPSLIGGTNYAVGGSQLLAHQQYGDEFSIQGQVMSYLESVGKRVPKEDTLIVFVGSTDIVGSIAQRGFGGNSTPVDEMIVSLKSIVSMLLSAKARDIILVNQYDISLSPSSSTGRQGQGQSRLFTQRIRALCEDWNEQLTLYAAEIGAKVVDLHTLFNNIVANMTSYGFENVTGFFGYDFTTDTAPPYQPEDPSKYLWFDQVHPTTEGHAVIATVFSNVLEKRFADPALAMYNADTDMIIGLLGNSIDLCLFEGIGLTIVAVVAEDRVWKVSFRLLDDRGKVVIKKRVESVPPFSLGGDIGDDLLPVPALSMTGNYTLIVKPTSGKKKKQSFEVLTCP